LCVVFALSPFCRRRLWLPLFAVAFAFPLQGLVGNGLLMTSLSLHISSAKD
jgi:hypothetical protein